MRVFTHRRRRPTVRCVFHANLYESRIDGDAVVVQTEVVARRPIALCLMDAIYLPVLKASLTIDVACAQELTDTYVR